MAMQRELAGDVDVAGRADALMPTASRAASSCGEGGGVDRRRHHSLRLASAGSSKHATPGS